MHAGGELAAALTLFCCFLCGTCCESRYQEQAQQLSGERPFQAAQSFITKWYKASPPRWTKGKKWKELDPEEKQGVVRTLAKTRYFKTMKNIGLKAQVATFCHLVLTQGYPAPGRSKGDQRNVGKREPTLKQPDLLTAKSFLCTLHVDAPEEFQFRYGPQVHANIDVAAQHMKEDPAYQSMQSEVVDFVGELFQGFPDGFFAGAGELCPQSWESGVVQVHFHVYLLRKSFLVMRLEPYPVFQRKISTCVVV